MPDPNSNSRSFESRLEAIERHLNLRSPAPAKPRTYDDQFKSRNSTGTGNGTNTTEDPAFPPFKKGGTTADDPNAPFEENVNKPVLSAPAPGPAPDATGTAAGAAESVIQTRKPAAGSVDENSSKKNDQGLRLDTRVTSRAVSPRERQTIVIGGANAAIATAKKPATLKVDARSINVAKY
ncbi:MAG: hypothetical protein JSS49_15310 [Planctomycetes bacterium]|nr:hypothetical protein [Planctomycetota bacterium]